MTATANSADPAIGTSSAGLSAVCTAASVFRNLDVPRGRPY
jgi:hypothetical protein